MKKLWSIALLVVVLGAISFPAAAQSTGLHFFSSSSGAFGFSYPADWTFSESKPTEAVGKNPDQSITVVIDYPAVTVHGPADTALHYEQSAAADMAQYLTAPKVRAFPVGAYDGARMDADSARFGGIVSFAVEYPDQMASMMFLGQPDALRREEKTITSIVSSFLPIGQMLDDAESSVGDTALTDTFTIRSGAFSIRYPGAWSAYEMAGDLAGFATKDNFVLVVSFDAEAAGQSPSSYLAADVTDAAVTSLKVGGHRAARADNSRVLHGGELVVELEGGLATFNWVAPPELVDKYYPTVEAMALSLEPGEAAHSTPDPNATPVDPDAVQPVPAPDGAYTADVPADWTLQADKNDPVIDFSTPGNAVTGALRYSPATKTAREFLAGFIADAGLSKAPDTYTVNGFPVAWTSISNGSITIEMFALQDGNGHLFMLSAFGSDADVNALEERFKAVIASFQPTGASTTTSADASEPDTTGAEALTESFTAGNQLFSIRYPKGWQQLEVDAGTVALRSPDGLVFVGGFPAGDASEAPRDYLSKMLGSADFTDLEINGRPATRMDNNKTLRGGGAMVIDFDGTYAYLNWIGTPDQIERAMPTLMAMAESFEVNSASSAEALPLTESYTVANGAYSIRYPSGWTATEISPGIVAIDDGSGLMFDVAYPTTPNIAPADYLKLLMKGSQPTEFDLNGSPAARVDDSALLKGGTGIAMEVNGQLAYFTWLGAPAQLSQAEPTLMAMVDSIRAVISADDVAASVSGQLSETFTEDGAYSFRYPASWTVSAVNNGAAVAFTDSASGVKGQLLFGKPSMSAKDYLAALMKTNGAPDAEIEEFHLGGQMAAAAVVPNGSAVGRFIARDFADGSVLVLAALGPAQKVANLESVLIGVVASFQSVSATPAPTTVARGRSMQSSAAACTITASSAVNLRSGPGTSFAKAGSLDADAAQTAIGQAEGRDGSVWWQLEGGAWVRSDLVTSNGACAALPTAAP